VTPGRCRVIRKVARELDDDITIDGSTDLTLTPYLRAFSGLVTLLPADANAK
jgi:hypothetical protein